jgi:hypothetical protein
MNKNDAEFFIGYIHTLLKGLYSEFLNCGGGGPNGSGPGPFMLFFLGTNGDDIFGKDFVEGKYFTPSELTNINKIIEDQNKSLISLQGKISLKEKNLICELNKYLLM